MTLSVIQNPNVDPPLSGATVGRYRVRARIATGGMADMYLAEHLETQGEVALKVMHLRLVRDEELAARFKREVEVMGRLAGAQNIVPIHDAGALEDGRRYLVMEFVVGTDLQGELFDLRSNNESMDVQRACRIARDVALAMQSIHAAQIIHRDLKPANVMLRRGADGQEHAFVVDFGVSADLKPKDPDQELTKAGSIIGTDGYMAPEQAAGVAPSPGFDIYGIGILLYEMVVGDPLPPGNARASIPPVSTLRPGIPQSLDSLIRRCLAWNPVERPESAAAVVQALDGILAEYDEPAPSNLDAPTSAVPPSSPAATIPGEAQGKKKRAGLIAALAIMLLIVLGGTVFALLGPLGEEDAVEEETHVRPVAVAKSLPEDDSEPDSQPEAEPEPTIAPTVPEAPPHEEPPSPAESEAPPEPQPEPSKPAKRSTSPKNPQAAPPPHLSAECQEVRGEASNAKGSWNWRNVLESTKRSECWKDREARLMLRVEAHAELGQFEACVREGQRSRRPEIRALVETCQTQLETP